MPMGEYENFEECEKKNQDKENPAAYCGEIKKRTEDATSPENNDQNQMEVDVKTPDDQENMEPGFYVIDGKLHQIDEKGDMYELDFDISNEETNSIKNNIEEKNEMESQEINSTSDQKDDPRWAETSQTKIDGSVAMMEMRISKCMEDTGRSYEECSEEVKKKMEDKTGTRIKTEDIEEPEITEDVQEPEEETKDEPERVDVCKKEYDMLKAKAEELEKLKVERKDMITDFKKYEKLFNEIKAERDAEAESKRQDKIKQLSKDFDIPEEELKDDSMKELLKTERRLDMAIKRDNPEEEEDIYEEAEDMADDFKGRWFMEV